MRQIREYLSQPCRLADRLYGGDIPCTRLEFITLNLKVTAAIIGFLALSSFLEKL